MKFPRVLRISLYFCGYYLFHFIFIPPKSICSIQFSFRFCQQIGVESLSSSINAGGYALMLHELQTPSKHNREYSKQICGSMTKSSPDTDNSQSSPTLQEASRWHLIILTKSFILLLDATLYFLALYCTSMLQELCIG